MDLQIIQSYIIEVRGSRVMLDFHLAELYEVETRALKQAVRRNMNRFPPDFMFELTNAEAHNLVSQFVIPSMGALGGAKPFVFTEQGVAMLSTILRSQKAIEINITIMRAFVLLRQYLTDYKTLQTKIEELETGTNQKFDDVYQALNYLLSPAGERNPIGFKIGKKDADDT